MLASSASLPQPVSDFRFPFPTFTTATTALARPTKMSFSTAANLTNGTHSNGHTNGHARDDREETFRLKAGLAQMLKVCFDEADS
jgi:hypothetical protein